MSGLNDDNLIDGIAIDYGEAAAFMNGVNDIDEHKKGYKLYNFRRPDKFSKDHLRGLQDIHREFSRQLALVLTAYLRMHLEVDVVSVDQLTYDEFMRSVPNPISIAIFELNPLPGQILLGISFEVISSIVDRMLGGVGTVETKARELTDVEESLVKKMIERTIQTLADAWSHVMPVESSLIGLDNNYSGIQVATPGEIVALITLEVHIAGKHYGLISLCFPYPVLENILSQLTTQHIFQTKGIIATSEERQKMIEKLDTSHVDINVIFGETEISTKDFLDLKEGDVLRLDNAATEDMIVRVNGERKFYGRPGKIKDKICIKITDRYDYYVDALKRYF
jgi:flagellar motor switch protein FliM